MRPAGTEGWSEEQLAALVTRDCMIGTGLPKRPGGGRVMNGVHDMGGMHGFGKVEPEPNEPPFHAAWEGRVLAMQRAMRLTRAPGTSTCRATRRNACRRTVYLAASYYQRWALGWSATPLEHGLVDADELAAGHALRPGKPLTRELTTDDRRQRVHARLVLPRRRPARRALQARRPGAHEEHPSADATRGCRATRAAMTAWSSACAAATSSRTRSRPATARTRNGSTRWCSTARELWGADADPTLKVSVEAFEPYLEPA